MQTLLEFVGAIAGVHQVRVAVDETRRDEAALAVDVFGGRQLLRIARGAGEGNESAPAGDEAVGDEPQSLVARESRKVSVAPDAVTVHAGTI